MPRVLLATGQCQQVAVADAIVESVCRIHQGQQGAQPPGRGLASRRRSGSMHKAARSAGADSGLLPVQGLIRRTVEAQARCRPPTVSISIGSDFCFMA